MFEVNRATFVFNSWSELIIVVIIIVDVVPLIIVVLVPSNRKRGNGSDPRKEREAHENNRGNLTTCAGIKPVKGCVIAASDDDFMGSNK